MAKIFILMDDPRINTGYAYTGRNTIDHLTKLGHECIAFAFNSGLEQGFYNKTVVLSTPKHKVENINEQLYGTKDYLINIYNNLKPDILFFHNDFYRQTWFFDLPQEIQDKSIWWIPFDVLRKSPNIDTSYFHRIKNLYLVTNHAAEICEIPNEKVIPHAINEIYFNLPAKPKLDKYKNKFVISRIDRHQPRKQWPYALHAYSIFAKDKDDVHFIAKCNTKDQAGQDPDTMDFIDLKEFSNRVEIPESKIEFKENFSSIEEIIEDILDQSDVFLTTTGSEGFGLGVVEGMSRGCVPIYPYGSSLPEVIGNNGYPYNYSEIRMSRSNFAEYGRPDVNQIVQRLNEAYTEWKNNINSFDSKKRECILHVSSKYHPNEIYSKWNEEINSIITDNAMKNLEIAIKKYNPHPDERKIDYSIIIVSKDKFEMLKDCLDSIIEKTKESYEIIIVNNCSQRETELLTEEYCRSYNNIKLIHNDKEGGFTYANNIGINIAEGKYIVLLNNDTVIENQDWLSIPTKQMEIDNADLIGPSKCWMNLASSTNEIPKSIMNLNVVYFNEYTKSYCCDFTGFWFVIGKRELFDKIKLNENIVSYLADDVDYCLQMTKDKLKWTYLKDNYSDGKGLLKHLGEQSVKSIDDRYKKGMKEFFDCWKELDSNNPITVSIPTRNRSEHLKKLLISLMNQSSSEWDLIISNDGDEFDKELYSLIDIIKEKHKVKILSGPRKGPAYAHQLMMENCSTDWIFRVDDDNVLDKDCLSNILETLICNKDVGAIAPLVLNPYQKVNYIDPPEVKINDFMSAAVAQQNKWNGNYRRISAEHLHSCFLYNREAALKVGGFIYSNELSNSIVSFGEETVFTYKLFFNGYQLLIDPKAITWHYQSDKGGTRDNNEYFNSRDKDFKVFMNAINNIKKKEIKYSVVIPTYNHLEDYLKPCIESIIKNTNLDELEIIVVSNGSKEDSRAYLESCRNEIKNFRYLWYDEPLGYTRATNEGIKVSSGKYIILLNDDTVILGNNWINILEKPFIEDSLTGITGPVKFSWDCGGIKRNAMAFWCVMISKEMFDKFGMLDEIFSPGMGEDGDFSIKVEEGNYKLIQVPYNSSHEFGKEKPQSDFPIYHKGNGTFEDESLQKNEIIMRNKKILEDRYGSELEKIYNLCHKHECDINEHFPTLRKYSEKCKHITEFGVRGVFSTYAFLVTKPNRLVCYDIEVSPNIWTADKLAKDNNVSFSFMERDTINTEIEETDLLFIDTKHTYKQLKKELELHASKVRKYIIMHDTSSYGISDENQVEEDGEKHGLNLAIKEFIELNNEWKIEEIFHNNNGLTILSKNRPDVSIVIPTYNHLEDCLKPCIESIIQYTDLSNTEVIISANGCIDGTKEYVEALGHPFKLVFIEEQLGYTKATNLGIKEARGKYIVLLNNDTVLLPQAKNTWIDKLKSPFMTDEKTGVSGPLKLHDAYSDKDVIIFFCCMIKREMFEEFGLLDEIFSPGGGEDVDFCAKVLKGGFKLVQVPQEGSLYKHEAGTNSGCFEIWHKDNQSFKHIPEYKSHIVKKNGLVNCLRYNTDIRLNLGSGGLRYRDPEDNKEYINIDLYDDRADYIFDITKLDELFKENSVSVILLSHVFEHLNPYKIFGILQIWFKVLKPGAKLIMELPNIEELCRRFVTANKAERYGILNAIYGSVNTHQSLDDPNLDPSNITSPHLFGWYPEILYDHLAGVGFKDIVFMEEKIKHPESNMRVEARK